MQPELVLLLAMVVAGGTLIATAYILTTGLRDATALFGGYIRDAAGAYGGAIRYAAKSAAGRVHRKPTKEELVENQRLKPIREWLSLHPPETAEEEGDMVGLYEKVVGLRPARDSERADALRRLEMRGVPIHDMLRGG